MRCIRLERVTHAQIAAINCEIGNRNLSLHTPIGCECEFGKLETSVISSLFFIRTVTHRRQTNRRALFRSSVCLQKLRGLDRGWRRGEEVGRHRWCCRSAWSACQTAALRKNEAERTSMVFRTAWDEICAELECPWPWCEC